MLIVGEKINTSTKSIAQAVQTSDAAFICKVARDQGAAGAHFIDVNAGTFLKEEVDYLPWLVETVQGAVDIPLCLDSPNPEALVKALECHKGEPMINSISLEGAGFTILDLGVDVSPETFVQEVKKENMGVDIGDIDVIYLAGALGNYINPYSAMRIGLIPRLDPEKITPLGNAASTGAKMVLLSRRCWEKSAQNLKVVISNKRTPNQLPHQTR